ncbi:MAG: hypothetical protein AAF908_03610 [Pseudomonadota bacterium]
MGVPETELTAASLAFSFSPGARATAGLSASLSNNFLLDSAGHFALTAPEVKLQVSQAAPAEGVKPHRPAIRSGVTAKLTLAGQTLDILMGLANDEIVSFVIMPEPATTRGATSALIETLAGAEAVTAISDMLEVIHIDSFSLDRAEVAVDIIKRKPVLVAVSGGITLGGQEVALRAILAPDPSISAELKPGQSGDGLMISELVQSVLGANSKLPRLAVDQFAFFYGAGTMSLIANTTEDWTLDLSAGTGQAAITLKEFNFDYTGNFSGNAVLAQATLTLVGLDLNVQLSFDDDTASWRGTAEGQAPEGTQLDAMLASIAQALGVDTGPILAELGAGFSSVAVQKLSLSFDQGSGEFSVEIELDKEGDVPLGLKHYKVGLSLSLEGKRNTSGGHDLSGALAAELIIGDQDVRVTFRFGEITEVTGSWQTVDGENLTFADITEAIGIEGALPLPNGLDAGLTSIAFSFKTGSDGGTFALAAAAAHLGDSYLTAGKDDQGKWTAVAGIEIDGVHHLSDLPVVGKDLGGADFLTFTRIGLMVSLGKFEAYAMPPLPPLPGAGLKVAPIAAKTPVQATMALSYIMEIDLGTGSTDKRIGNLAHFIKPDSAGQKDLDLVMQGVLSDTGLMITGFVDGSVVIPGPKFDIGLASPALSVEIGEDTYVQVQGGVSFSLPLPLQADPIVIDGSVILTVQETGADADFKVTFQNMRFPPPYMGVHPDTYGLSLGLQFTPPGLDIGILGSYYIGDDKTPQPDEFALIFEMVEEVPDILFLSFYANEISLPQAVTMVSNQALPGALDVLGDIKVSDLSFYWCESIVTLPDATQAQPLLGFSGAIELASFSAQMALELKPAGGQGASEISFSAQMAPINLRDILHVAGDGRAVTKKIVTDGEKPRPVKNNTVTPWKSQGHTTLETLVPAGGPVAEFDLMNAPFVHLSAEISLFDLVKEKIQATVSVSGLSFSLDYSALRNVEDVKLACTLDSAGFDGEGA